MLHIFISRLRPVWFSMAGSGWATVRDRAGLDKFVRECVLVRGEEVDSVGSLGEDRMDSRMKTILNNTGHPLNNTKAKNTWTANPPAC